MRIDRRYVTGLLESVVDGSLVDHAKLRAAFISLAEALLKIDAYAGQLESDAAARQVHTPTSPDQGLAQQLFVYAMSSVLGEFNVDFEGKAKRIREDALHAAEIFYKVAKEPPRKQV